MPIIGLEGRNFKVLKAIQIFPSATLQVISGPNGAGKSTVLDMIDATLRGANASPECPIRLGCDEADSRLTFEDMIIERNWTKTKTGQTKTELKVFYQGKKTPEAAPQSFIDRLIGNGIGFDGMAFARMEEEQQVETIRKMTGMDVRDLDVKRKAIFDERTIVNRSIKERKGQLAGLPEVKAPDDEVSLSDLLEHRTAAAEEVQVNRRARDSVNALAVQGRTALETVNRLKSQLAEAEAALEKLRAEYKTADAKASNLQDPDIDEIDAQLREIETVNRNVRTKRQRTQLVTKIQSEQEAADNMTAQLDAIDIERARRIEEAAAKLPVPGITIEDKRVLLNGVPLKQGSSAEQIRTGFAISAALNPGLKLAFSKEGSLLDDQGMAAVEAWSKETGTQVWLERVARDEPEGIVIEDGEVAAERVPVTA